MNAPLLIFDIETMPDIETGRQLYPNLKELSDDDALTALTAIRNAEAGHDFMRLPLHKVVCLSFLWVENEVFTLKSLSLDKMGEAQILTHFLRAFKKKPTLISWNGSGFDLPVLLYRMTHHKMNAKDLMNAGTKQYDYLNRFSSKHIDLMDKFSFGAWGNKQKLDTMAGLCGFAGKGEMEGSQVVPMVQNNQWQQLVNYCESDVLNTWFIYLRYLLLTGVYDEAMYEAMVAQSCTYIQGLTNADGSLRHDRFLM